MVISVQLTIGNSEWSWWRTNYASRKIARDIVYGGQRLISACESQPFSTFAGVLLRGCTVCMCVYVCMWVSSRLTWSKLLERENTMTKTNRTKELPIAKVLRTNTFMYGWFQVKLLEPFSPFLDSSIFSMPRFALFFFFKLFQDFRTQFKQKLYTQSGISCRELKGKNEWKG